MAEFDLIPADYALGRMLRRRMKCFLVTLAAIAGMVALMWLGLHSLLVMERSEVARLQERARHMVEAKARLEQDRERTRGAERQLEALDDLRGRDRLLVFIKAIDAAYVDGVWFDEVRFFRREKLVARAPEAATRATQPPRAGGGKEQAGSNATAKLPDIEQAAEIAGYAVNHSALAEFVRKLGDQPGISGVQLIDSGMRTTADVQAIEARIALLVGDKSRGPQ